MEKIDILLATYNGEKFLNEQLDSILNQTYSNFNLYISDDCSKDNTKEILKEYEKKDARIKLFFQEKNLGYIGNFEFLLKQVESKYYMLSDQDDVWLKEKIEKSFNKLINSNSDLVYTDLEIVDQNLKMIYPSMWKNLKIEKKVKYDDIRSQYLYNCATGCTIISKSEYIKYMLPFPKKSVYMPHDYWIALVVALKGKIAHLDEKTIKYRQHGNNQIGTEKTSHKFNKFEQVRELFLKVKIEHFEDYVKRTGIFTTEQNIFNKKCLEYFLNIKEKNIINFKNIGIFHKLYKYDTMSYYIIQYVIMNIPIIAKFCFNIRYKILKIQGKR